MGSKADLLQDTSPLREEATQLAQREDMLYAEVSAKTGVGVGRLFTDVVKRLLSAPSAPGAEEVEAEAVVVKLGAASEGKGCC